jgi:hypothetical protein
VAVFGDLVAARHSPRRPKLAVTANVNGPEVIVEAKVVPDPKLGLVGDPTTRTAKASQGTAMKVTPAAIDRRPTTTNATAEAITSSPIAGTHRA